MTLREYILDNYSTLADAQQYEAIANSLNASTTISNPDPQGQVEAPLSMAALQGLLTDEEMAFVITQDSFTSLASSILTTGTTEAKAKIRSVLTALSSQATGGMSLLQVTNLLVALNNRSSLSDLTDALEAHGSLSAITVATIKGALSATIPDPSYEETVPGPSLAEQNGFGFVFPRDVQWALEVG